MALEAVVFPSLQDEAVTSYDNTNWFGGEDGGCSSSWSYDFSINHYYSSEIIIPENNNNFANNNNNNDKWEEQNQMLATDWNNNNSSPEGESGVAVKGGGGGGERRKRRRRSIKKNKEEVEQQRMTHIAVERNRRKQMNDYLSLIRSLMPPSYSQRGDQASIVGGAINYVKELEQLLQSLQANKKRTKQADNRLLLSDSSHDHENNKGGSLLSTNSSSDDNVNDKPIFGDFFNFPQYSSSQPNSNNSVLSSNSELGEHEIEVTMVDGHANVRILAKKHQKQLLRLVAAFQGLRLSVLHLNLTTLHPFVLYSFNLKVEEGCQLNSVDDVAAAANHILTQIQHEAAS